ncbi:TolC family protein [Pseudomonas aeruginosa]|uniref:TolC family protein n=1 Tax=Pseudomonadaceae TaxID=135621 RepID=UPI0016253C62|nr:MULTISPECIES: TolC family protein [Pseudomonadaceae]MBG7303423.1 TolC family protein [Pseudomonas aeruginosa]MDH0184702.1 TolC family protein [Stutzerimonas stutzeri]MDH1249147.1 TolC family protein [Stutzerimonas stutzeri]HBP6433517.1 TolC family protein [Pseudomonas aeruginosa]
MKVLRLVVWGLVGICGTSVAQAADPLRLEEAVARALASHPSIVAERAQLQAVQARADREGLPPPYIIGGEVENVAGTGSLRGVDSAETTLRIGRVIELGGKREARQTLGRAEVREQEHRADTVRIDLASLTATRFIEVLAKQQRLEYAEERIQQAEHTRREVAAWVTAARNPESDLQAAEIALAEAELDRESAEHELASAKMTLAASWGALMPDFGEVVGDLQFLPTVEPFEALAARLSMTPELRAARLQADTIAARSRIAEASAKPDIDVSLGVRRMEAFNDHGLVMSVSVPLGSRTRSGYSVAQANAELAALEARRDAERFERHQALFERYQELVHARHELESLRTNMIPKAENALATTRRGFEAGRFSFISLAQAQKTLFDLRARAVEASSRYHLLLVEVERLTATVEDMTL